MYLGGLNFTLLGILMGFKRKMIDNISFYFLQNVRKLISYLKIVLIWLTFFFFVEISVGYADYKFVEMGSKKVKEKSYRQKSQRI